jgi:hypothetical protein
MLACFLGYTERVSSLSRWGSFFLSSQLSWPLGTGFRCSVAACLAPVTPLFCSARFRGCCAAQGVADTCTYALQHRPGPGGCCSRQAGATATNRSPTAGCSCTAHRSKGLVLTLEVHTCSFNCSVALLHLTVPPCPPHLRTSMQGQGLLPQSLPPVEQQVAAPRWRAGSIRSRHPGTAGGTPRLRGWCRTLSHCQPLETRAWSPRKPLPTMVLGSLDTQQCSFQITCGQP